MLEELKEFLEIPPTPQEIKIYTKYMSTKKNSLTNSYCNDLRRINYSKRVSVMEQIAQRRKKEEKEKKKEMLKNLNKNKRINLKQFLNRMQDCEQKRKYNLELKKYEKLKQEVSTLQDKPKINSTTVKFCENGPKEPLYKRTEEVLNDKKKVMKNLTIFHSLPKEIQNQANIMRNRHNKKKYFSAESSKNDYNDNEYTIRSVSIDNIKKKKLRNKNNKKKEKMTRQKSDEFYYRQEQWYKNKKAKEENYEKLYQMQNYSYSNATFHPYVNQVTLEILDLKNRENTNNEDYYKYNITNSKSQPGDGCDNNGKTIFDKLYDDRYKKIYISQKDFFKENFNYNYNLNQKKKKNKYRNVPTRYLDIYKPQQIPMLNKNGSFISQGYMYSKMPYNKKHLKINKSYDDFSSAKYFNDIPSSSRNNKKIKQKNINYNYYYNLISEEEPFKKNKKTEEFDNYLWKNTLLSLEPSPGKSTDQTYHLNIRHKGAWDNNITNQIILNKNVNTRSVLESIRLK